jgi:hypothetical protein
VAWLAHPRFFLTLAVFLGLPGGAAFGQTLAELARNLTPRPQNPGSYTTSYAPAAVPHSAGPPAAGGADGVVFAVDGSAGLRHISDDLQQAMGQAQLPLEVVDFSWSNGAGRVFADLRGQSHHQAKGQELADLILARRRSCPGGRIDVVCHSSGAAVVLAAAGALPPGSVDHIILLAPAVSPYYDLRPALACARDGIDCYYCPWDLTSCSLALVGTTDGYHLPSAGCLGFSPAADDAAGGAYQNLRQHAWSPGMASAGYFGGHYGCTRLGFFQAYVVPLLAQGADGG